jgi:hypothetical protein
MKKIYKNKTTPIIQAIIIVLGIFGAYYYFVASQPAPAPQLQNQSENWKTYSNQTNGYEISYPVANIQHVTATESGLLNPNVKVQREKFTVAESFTKGTNLSSDSGMIIEIYNSAYLCQADYIPAGFQDAQTATIKGVKYSVAVSDGAAAGNRYQQKVYKTLQNNKCISIFVNTHSTNIGNYEPGTIKEFNKASFDSVMSRMLDTFKVTVVN